MHDVRSRRASLHCRERASTSRCPRACGRPASRSSRTRVVRLTDEPALVMPVQPLRPGVDNEAADRRGPRRGTRTTTTSRSSRFRRSHPLVPARSGALRTGREGSADRAADRPEPDRPHAHHPHRAAPRAPDRGRPARADDRAGGSRLVRAQAEGAAVTGRAEAAARGEGRPRSRLRTARASARAEDRVARPGQARRGARPFARRQSRAGRRQVAPLRACSTSPRSTWSSPTTRRGTRTRSRPQEQ